MIDVSSPDARLSFLSIQIVEHVVETEPAHLSLERNPLIDHALYLGFTFKVRVVDPLNDRFFGKHVVGIGYMVEPQQELRRRRGEIVVHVRPSTPSFIPA